MDVFVIQLCKTTINAGKHQNIAFYSQLLDMLYINISFIIISAAAVVINNNNFLSIVWDVDLQDIIHTFVRKIMALPYN